MITGADIQDNTVASVDVQDGSLTGVDISDASGGSLTGSDILESSLGEVPKAMSAGNGVLDSGSLTSSSAPGPGTCAVFIPETEAPVGKQTVMSVGGTSPNTLVATGAITASDGFETRATGKVCNIGASTPSEYTLHWAVLGT